MSGFRQRRYMVGKGLTVAQARAKLRARRVADFRSLSYSPRTGWATVV